MSAVLQCLCSYPATNHPPTGVVMSVVISGPSRGQMTHTVPVSASRSTIEGLRLAICQNEHVVHVSIDEHKRFVIMHDLNNLVGTRFSDAIIDLDEEITTLLRAARDARLLEFSNR